MKKSIYSILAILSLGLAAFSCAPEEVAYEKGEPDLEGCYGVYFPAQENIGSLVFDPAMTPEIELEVVRSVSTGECDVPFEVCGDAETFDFGTIHFEDGQTSTKLKVSFRDAEIGTSYSISIQITDPAYASRYIDGKIAVDITILRVEWIYVCEPDGTTPAKFTWVQNWRDEVHTGYVRYYEVDKGGDIGVLRTCETVTDPTYFEDGSVGYGFWGTAEKEEEATEWSFYWLPGHKLSDGSELIWLPGQETGYYQANYGADVYVLDDYYINGEDYNLSGFLAYAEDNEATMSYYDGNGGIYFYVAYYYMFGVGGWSQGVIDTYGIASGYIRPDYSFEVMSDYCDDGSLPVYAMTGRDITTLKIAVAEGSLTSTEVKKIINAINDNEDAVIVYGEYDAESDANYFATYLSDLGETGLYTLVVAGCDDQDEVQASTSLEVNYISTEDTEAYAVNITVGTEPTSPRYEGYNDTNSFAFYICGEDIVAANVACVPSEKLEDASYAEAYFNAVKYNNITGVDFSIPEEGVAQIGQLGGYSDVMGGLSALTDYTLIVWATNGDSDTFATAEYSTSGLPNELVHEGGLFGYSVFFPMFFDMDPPLIDELDVEYNPNTEMYEIPNCGYDVTFKFSIDEETGAISVPEQYVGLSMSGYGDFYVLSPDNFDEMWTEWLEEDGVDLSQPSYADETGYHFYVAYYTSVGYYFGIGYEHYLFEMPEEWPGFESGEGGESTEGGENVETSGISFDLSKVQKSLRAYPAAGIKGYEREAQTVSVTAAPAQYKKAEKVKGIDMPMNSTRTIKKF